MKFKKMIIYLLKLALIMFYASSFYYLIGNDILNLNRLLSDNERILVVILYMFFLISFSNIFDGWKVGIYRIIELIYSQVLAIILSNIIMALILILLEKGMFSIFAYISYTIIEFGIVVLWTEVINTLYYKFNAPYQIVLIYGLDPKDLINKLSRRKNRFDIVDELKSSEELEKIYGKIDKYETVALYGVSPNLENEIIDYCFAKNKTSFVIPRISEIIMRNSKQLHIMDTPLFINNKCGLSPEERLVKRLFDLLVIIPVSIVSLPIMIIVALIIKCYDFGPVFYKQERLTINGKKFNVYKFRSMIVDAEKQSGAVLASENDKRITPVGKIIRKLRVDELPQIINILKGDMSIVGPRPERAEIAKDYEEKYAAFNYRLKVKAGLTGYAQILGKYNTSPIDKVKLDLMYIESYSILLDIKLVIMTIKILFMPESTEGVQENQKNALNFPDELNIKSMGEYEDD